jgi:hypothetical protein
MNKNIRLAQKHGSKVIPFKHLPLEARYAIIHYMAVDGEAWEVHEELAKAFEKCWKIRGSQPIEKEQAIVRQTITLPEVVSFYGNKYGDCKFGISSIPTSILKAEVLKRDYEAMEAFGNWDEYHKWYGENCGLPKHKKQYPWFCILSDSNDEVFQDGWHRFHRYTDLGLKEIPCVYYLDRENYKHKKVA